MSLIGPDWDELKQFVQEMADYALPGEPFVDAEGNTGPASDDPYYLGEDLEKYVLKARALFRMPERPVGYEDPNQ